MVPRSRQLLFASGDGTVEDIRRGAEPFVAPDSLPLGSARLIRPSSVRRIRFDDFIQRPGRGGSIPGILRKLAVGGVLPVVPLEAVAPDDIQVLAARGPKKGDSVSVCRIDHRLHEY
jgi:hypothetical protein